MRGLLPLALLTLMITTPAATAQGDPVDITLEAHDGGGAYWFQLPGASERNPELSLEPGMTYKITLANKGNAPHNLHLGGSIDQATPMVPPGDSADLTVTVPAGARAIGYWCDPHESLGMKGTAVATNDKDSPGLPLVGVMALVALAALGRRRA